LTRIGSKSTNVLHGDAVAYGPVLADFRASVIVESDWGRTVRNSPSGLSMYAIAAGMVFHLGPEGYYAFLLTGAPTRRAKLKSDEKQHLRFALYLRRWNGQQTEIIPWTDVPAPEAALGVGPPATMEGHKIAVEYTRGEIALFVDDQEVGMPGGNSAATIRRVRETTFGAGLTGFGVFGDGRALYRDLIVEGPQ
jgi:hypothetical protein